MPEDLTRWLNEAGLGAHAAAFAAEGVGFDVLEDLSEADLKELGLSVGDRKRLLKAVAAMSKGLAARPQEAGSSAPAAEAERRQVTVMFIDLIDSSPLAERFDPEEMRSVLRVFHAACAAAVETHEGHIAQYSGDGLLVYFGYPKAHEDDAVRSVLAGLAVIANLAAANIRLEAQYDVRLKVRIGVETGLVVAGEVGAGAALDRQAIVGETPIVAARLQALAPPNSLIVGPGTKNLIQGSFRLHSLGRHALKGVAAPIDIWRVDGRTEAEGTFEIRAGRGLTPLVGRGAELDMLRQRWRQSSEGEMRCVLLVGEPGIGKSRMLQAFRDDLVNEPHSAIAFHGSRYHRDSPFWPVLHRLQQVFDLGEALGEGSAAQLESSLALFDIDVSEAALVLANLFGLPTAGRYPAIDTTSPAFKRRTLDVLVAMIEAMARRGPLLLSVEDAHWVDPSTQELLSLLLERLTSSRLLLLITARPEFKPDWTSSHLVRLNLDRLSRRERVEMVERLTAGKPLPASVLEQIVAKTDGVPLFVEELTTTVLQGDLLHDTGARYELRGPLHSIAIPDTLQGSLLSRLDRLQPDVKEVAQAAATIGRDFDVGLLRRITPAGEAEVDAALERLVEAEVVLPVSGEAGVGDGGAFRFRHALIQEIAYQSLLLARRRRFHGLIGAALELDYPQVVERQPELLAQNFAASGSRDRAIEYWRLAGDRALARAAFQEAIAHVQAGIQLAQELPFSDHERAERTLPLLLIRGVVEYRTGERKAIATFQSAAGMARAERLPSYLVQSAMWVAKAEYYLNGTVVAATPLLERALVEIGDEESIDRCRLLSCLATMLVVSAGDRANEFACQAAIVARRLGDAQSLRDALICDLIHVGGKPLPKAKFAERRRTLEELSRTSESLGDAESLCEAVARSLTAYLEIGEFERFEASLERHKALATSSQDFVIRWIDIGAQAMRGILVGDFALAERKAEESFRLGENADATVSGGIYGMQMFTIRREQGRLAEVAPFIKRLVDDHPEVAIWRPGLMLIASDLGFDAEARRNLAKMAAEKFTLPADAKQLVTLSYIAEVAARLGAEEQVEAVYERLAPYADQAITVPTFTLCCGSTARYLGLLAGALGDYARAAAHFEQALAMNEAMSAWPWLAHTRNDYAQMLARRGRRGDQSRAMNLTGAALATARELGMTALIHRIGTSAGARSEN